MKWPSLNAQILAGAVLGVAIGFYFHGLERDDATVESWLYAFGLVGAVFIDLLKMILIPLVFTSIAVGIANLQAHKQVHRVWITTLCFFAFTMAIAIVLGMTANQVFRPGDGLDVQMFADAMQNFEANQLALPEFVAQFLRSLFVNPFAAFSQGNVLAVVIYALFVGIALVIGGERYQSILTSLREFNEITMQMVRWIMYLAPLGIMALLIQLIATQDASLFGSLGKFMLVVTGTTLLHGVVILPLILYLITKVTPLRFFAGAREALLTAFSTSSSTATLPVTLRCAEQNLQVRPDVAGFVVPLGATVNMDGTALYEATAALFVANLVGIDLSPAQQMIVFFTAMIAAIGAPGIPSAGMVTMVMVLQSVGLPAEAIAILLPIDRLLDTVRTAVNVEGDMIGSLVVQRFVKD
ncbi:MAG: dicarboxylate/amino acid:cation symporter [Burkholderiales bacterium]|nr:dicarboxylate/amino acid:cation symporter [Burkholderiales bacterium]